MTKYYYIKHLLKKGQAIHPKDKLYAHYNLLFTTEDVLRWFIDANALNKDDISTHYGSRMFSEEEAKHRTVFVPQFGSYDEWNQFLEHTLHSSGSSITGTFI